MMHHVPQLAPLFGTAADPSWLALASHHFHFIENTRDDTATSFTVRVALGFLLAAATCLYRGERRGDGHFSPMTMLLAC